MTKRDSLGESRALGFACLCRPRRSRRSQMVFRFCLQGTKKLPFQSMRRCRRTFDPTLSLSRSLVASLFAIACPPCPLGVALGARIDIGGEQAAAPWREYLLSSILILRRSCSCHFSRSSHPAHLRLSLRMTDQPHLTPTSSTLQKIKVKPQQRHWSNDMAMKKRCWVENLLFAFVLWKCTHSFNEQNKESREVL